MTTAKKAATKKTTAKNTAAKRTLVEPTLGDKRYCVATRKASSRRASTLVAR